MVHSAGGTLLQHLKELILHTDLKREDCIFYYTTCGWMMWNWLVSSLAVGVKVVLYDGAPLTPSPTSLWDMNASRLRYSILSRSSDPEMRPCSALALRPRIRSKTFPGAAGPSRAESSDATAPSVMSGRATSSWWSAPISSSACENG